VALPALWLARTFDLTTLPRLIGAGIAAAAVGALVTYLVALNNRDRQFLREVAPWRKKRAEQVAPAETE